MNGLSRHHLVPKSRGGKKKHGILIMSPDKHHAWHALFGNMTIGEVIETLVEINKKRRDEKTLYLH
jgi:hypothetical protein